MNKKLKILFIINPASGHKSRKPREAEILKFFQNKSFDVNIAGTNYHGHASELTQKAVNENCDIVVAVGGDGTVNEIASVLNNSGKVLGIIPCGSGNGLARHHRIPLNTVRALQLIENNNVVNHDAVKINNRLSFNVSGIGFDAHVAHLFGKDGKRGFMSYAKLVIREFSMYKEFHVDINNGQQNLSADSILVAIANGSQFGNNAHIAPIADTNDGKADITIVKKMKFWQLPAFALKVFNGTIGNSVFANALIAEKATISCNTQVPLHVDGEPAGYSNRFEISTLKGTLKLIVP